MTFDHFYQANQTWDYHQGKKQIHSGVQQLSSATVKKQSFYASKIVCFFYEVFANKPHQNRQRLQGAKSVEYSVKSCSIKQITKAERVESTDVQAAGDQKSSEINFRNFFKLFLFQPNVALGLFLMFQQMPLFGEEVNQAFLSLL